MWMCGAILAAVVSACPRFVEILSAGKDDSRTTCADCPLELLSPALADLTQRMMEADPSLRIGLHDVGAHPWCAQVATAAAQVRLYMVDKDATSVAFTLVAVERAELPIALCEVALNSSPHRQRDSTACSVAS